jgi:predicted phage terminase large subunit-like protein
MARPSNTPIQPNYSSFTSKQMAFLADTVDPTLKFLMSAGGIRSGKSWGCGAGLLTRAQLAPGSKHGIFHAYANVCRRNLFKQTFPELVEQIYPGYWSTLDAKGLINSQEMTIRLPNGSLILFMGLDEPDKVRGLEFSTIWVNEANLVDYKTIQTLQGRLNMAPMTLDGRILETKLMVDLNPTVKSSWEYQVFCEAKIPGTADKIANTHRYAWHLINPADNRANLAADYMEVFDAMTPAQRRRDELGMWSEDNPSALFQSAKIAHGPAPAECSRVVVSIDHAVRDTDKSDETGIIVAGEAGGRYYVLADHTMRAKPDVWAQKAVDLYWQYGADCILTESNQGGDLITSTIAKVDRGRNVPVRNKPATRNKVARAGPVSILYQRGEVTHAQSFVELEQQMVEFDAPTYKGHDDRVDALVYALLYLSERTAPRTVRVSSPAGFWR